MSGLHVRASCQVAVRRAGCLLLPSAATRRVGRAGFRLVCSGAAEHTRPLGNPCSALVQLKRACLTRQSGSCSPSYSPASASASPTAATCADTRLILGSTRLGYSASQSETARSSKEREHAALCGRCLRDGIHSALARRPQRVRQPAPRLRHRKGVPWPARASQCHRGAAAAALGAGVGGGRAPVGTMFCSAASAARRTRASELERRESTHWTCAREREIRSKSCGCRVSAPPPLAATVQRSVAREAATREKGCAAGRGGAVLNAVLNVGVSD